MRGLLGRGAAAERVLLRALVAGSSRGVRGFVFDTDRNVNVLELLSECQLGGLEREPITEPAVQPSTLEAKDSKSETTSMRLKAGVEASSTS